MGPRRGSTAVALSGEVTSEAKMWTVGRVPKLVSGEEHPGQEQRVGGQEAGMAVSGAGASQARPGAEMHF